MTLSPPATAPSTCWRRFTGIDVFIDGHSHSTLEEIKEATNGTGKVGDTVLTSTGTKLANVGMVDISPTAPSPPPAWPPAS
ncbi:MAG: hypothetical protein ACLSCQ_15175 [Evtepia gabavorous]